MNFLDTRYPRHTILFREIKDQIDTSDLSHDLTHVARVYHWAIKLSPDANADTDLAGAAALIHDLVNIPKESKYRVQAGEESAKSSYRPLVKAGYTRDEIEDIQFAVSNSSWSKKKNATTPLMMVLQDADRLDAIGAIGIARTFACAQGIHQRTKRSSLYDIDDPFAASRDPNDKHYALDHFQIKLLKIVEKINLPSAKAEAEKRQKLMQDFLDALAEEL